MKNEEILNKIKGVVDLGIQGFKKIPFAELSRKAKCGVGCHDVDLVNVAGKPLCYKEGKCLSCLEKIKKEEHVFGEYVPQGECTEVRTCIYCQEAKQTRITHRYSKFSVDEKCNVWGICEVCGHQRQMDEKQHQWEIVIEVGEKHKESKKCLRCGKTDKILGMF